MQWRRASATDAPRNPGCLSDLGLGRRLAPSHRMNEMPQRAHRPICHLHLRSFANRHQEVADSGITEVVFFHSAADALRGYQSLLPFAVIADPDRVQYREFGVEKSLGAITHPRALWAAVRGSAAMLHRNDPERAGVGFGDGTTHLGLPADFLLDADGTVAAVHYGRHADDQWSVDQLIDINRSLGGKGTQ